MIDTEPVPIVADASIANVAVGDGWMIPLLILDTSKRPDIEDMVKAQHHMRSQGDLTASWGRPDTFFDTGTVILILTFEKPSRCLILLQFDIEQYGGIVDKHHSQPGPLTFSRVDRGTECARTRYNPRILAEVSSREFQPEWNNILGKAMRKVLQKKHGMSRAKAKLATEKFIDQWRDLLSKRVKGPVEGANEESSFKATE